MAKIRVSVIITYYSDPQKLFDTIDSVLKHKPKYAELIVVDNSEKDKISNLKKNKDLIYIKAGSNRGYGAGNNLGAANATGEYLFFLNPDTLINKKTIPELVKFFKNHKKAGVVGPNLLDPEGNIYPQLGSNTLTPWAGMIALSFVHTVWPDNPISNHYWNVYQDQTRDREVAVVPGSALMIRRDIFEKINGFDENIFLYFDESDLCIRVQYLDYKIYFAAKSEVVHHWKFNRKEDPSLKKHFVKSRFYYFRKHYGIIWAVIVEVFTRMSRILALFF